MPEQLATIIDVGPIRKERSISEFDAKIAHDLETAYQQVRTIPELGDSIGLGGGRPEGMSWQNGNIQIRGEATKTAHQQFEESCTVTTADGEGASVQLIRSYDPRQGDEADGSFRVRRFDATTGEVSEFAIDSTQVTSETRPVTIYQPNGQTRTEQYPPLEYESEVSAIVDELQAGVAQTTQPVAPVEQPVTPPVERLAA